jgi:hypothetical protein
MPIFASVASLALRPVLESLTQQFGVGLGERSHDAVADFILSRLTDQGARLLNALQRANDQTWRCLEIALAGESLLSRLDRVEHKQFRDHLRQFLAAAVPFSARADEFRTDCLRELRAARAAGLFVRGFDAKQAAETAAFARYAQPGQRLEQEWRALAQAAEALRAASCTATSSRPTSWSAGTATAGRSS